MDPNSVHLVLRYCRFPIAAKSLTSRLWLAVLAGSFFRPQEVDIEAHVEEHIGSVRTEG
jgi:hypothetical protein